MNREMIPEANSRHLECGRRPRLLRLPFLCTPVVPPQVPTLVAFPPGGAG